MVIDAPTIIQLCQLQTRGAPLPGFATKSESCSLFKLEDYGPNLKLLLVLVNGSTALEENEKSKVKAGEL
jgi:hypothetical protein